MIKNDFMSAARRIEMYAVINKNSPNTFCSCP